MKKGGAVVDQTFEKRKKVMLDFISDDLYVPMKIREIAAVLQIPREQRDDLKAVLDALVDDGKITLSKRGKYSRGEAARLKGVFQANARGFGFVRPEDESGDVYISEENLCGAFHGDEVEYIITGTPAGRRKEGKIVRVLSHNIVRIVGLYERSKGFGFVRPDDQRYMNDIYIPAGKEKGAMTGHKVVVELTSYGEAHMKPEGEVAEIIGHVNDPGTDILSIVMDMGIPMEFPERVLNQAVRVGKEVSEADCAGRKDLRSWTMVTIDGEDAKDLDDAVSLTKEGENYRLGVHIADVANYVQEGSALDREALERGTSVYLADRVIPMLPHKLSNGICSLNAGEDRLALSCIMTIDPRGEIVEHEIAETVIRVDKRMSYNGVAAVLAAEAEGEDCREYPDYGEYVPMLCLMKELADKIRERRGRRGSVNFDFPETKIELDEDGRPREIRPYERNAATKIIEDFMLLANETVAEKFFWLEAPFIYRVHENPDIDKVKELNKFLFNMGYRVKCNNEEVHPTAFAHVLNEAKGKPEERVISNLILRTLKVARYESENKGHFGIASKYYCHFTSPIRRYPDLFIHRIISRYLKQSYILSEEEKEKYSTQATKYAEISSECEKIAQKVERESVDIKIAEYMEGHIGEEYDGIISSITSFGVFPNSEFRYIFISEEEG